MILSAARLQLPQRARQLRSASARASQICPTPTRHRPCPHGSGRRGRRHRRPRRRRPPRRQSQAQTRHSYPGQPLRRGQPRTPLRAPEAARSTQDWEALDPHAARERFEHLGRQVGPQLTLSSRRAAAEMVYNLTPASQPRQGKGNNQVRAAWRQAVEEDSGRPARRGACGTPAAPLRLNAPT